MGRQVHLLVPENVGDWNIEHARLHNAIPRTGLGDRFRGGLDNWDSRVDDSLDGLDNASGTL